MKSKNYELKRARVNFIMYWLKEGAAQEIRIILPELSSKGFGKKINVGY